MNDRRRLIARTIKFRAYHEKTWRNDTYIHELENGKMYKISLSVKGSPVNLNTLGNMLSKQYEEGIEE